MDTDLGNKVTENIRRLLPHVWQALLDSPQTPWFTRIPDGIKISALAGRIMPAIGGHHLQPHPHLDGVVCDGSHVGSRIVFLYLGNGNLTAAMFWMRDEAAGLFSTASIAINDDGSLSVMESFLSSRPLTVRMGTDKNLVGDSSYIFATTITMYLEQSYMDDGSSGNPASGVGRSTIDGIDLHYFRAMDMDTLHSDQKVHLSPRMLPDTLRSLVKELRAESDESSLDMARKLDLTEQLWWVSEDMSALAWDAILSESYPDDLSEKELPSPNGIMWLDGGGGPGMLVLDPLDRDFYEKGRIKPDILSFDAVYWWTPSSDVAKLRAEEPGTVNFYGLSASPRLAADTNRWDSRLSISAIGSYDLSESRLVMHSAFENGDLARLIILTAMRLSREEIVSERRVESVKSGSKKKRVIDSVTLVSLRRRRYASDEEKEAEAREYSHRWIVRGHMRNQPVGPRNADGGQRHERVYIAPYIKGPEDKPLVLKDRVQVWRR